MCLTTVAVVCCLFGCLTDQLAELVLWVKLLTIDCLKIIKHTGFALRQQTVSTDQQVRLSLASLLQVFEYRLLVEGPRKFLTLLETEIFTMH